MEEQLDLYDKAMRNLDRMAAADLQDWWEAGNRHGRDPEDLIDYLAEPFTDITQRYGTRAAYLTVDAMIVNRNLDEELRWLPYPTPEEAAKFEQAHSSLEWSVHTSKLLGEFDSTKARKKLRGALNRLVYQPARRTVERAVKKDGTAYARIPSPGACSFCLMLAARGPAYLRDNVVSTKQIGQYHDNCRCLGWEARGRTPEERWASLPPINRQLDDLWNKNIPGGSSGDASKEQRGQWRELIVFKRREMTGSDTPVRFPPIPGLRFPRRTKHANHAAFGDVEPLPLVTNDSAGHFLFGWKYSELGKLGKGPGRTGRSAHEVSDRLGHLYGSKEKGKTVFPEEWTPQDIVHAVHKTIEDPESYQTRGSYREARKWVDGVLVEACWDIVGKGSKRTAVLKTAYPIRGRGVMQVKGGKLVEPTKAYSKDEFFIPVKGKK